MASVHQKQPPAKVATAVSPEYCSLDVVMILVFELDAASLLLLQPRVNKIVRAPSATDENGLME
jgi:hypothetical protein